MAVNPQDRYQSPSEFRRALEAICLHCDWRLRRKRKNIVYYANIGQTRYQVTIKQARTRKFEIETKKQVGANPPRKVARDCEKGFTLGKMKKKIRRILQRYVLLGK
jgi:hypothetical protein